MPPAGLQVSEDGNTLEVLSTGLAAGVPAEFEFRIVGADGHAGHGVRADARQADAPDRRAPRPVRVPARAPDDGRGRHLAVPLTFAAAGDYRVFADFQPKGAARGSRSVRDVPVAGAYTPTPLPARRAHAATVDGYRVTLRG